MKSEFKKYIKEIREEYDDIVYNHVNSADELTEYLMRKDGKKAGWWDVGASIERIRDQISSLYIFGHGYNPVWSKGLTGTFQPAHGGVEENDITGEQHQNWEWGKSQVSKLDPMAFEDDAECTLHKCNSATEGIEGNSLAKELSEGTQTKVTGWIGTSEYGDIYEEGLPAGGNGPADNDVAPGIKGDGSKAEKKSYDNRGIKASFPSK